MSRLIETLTGRSKIRHKFKPGGRKAKPPTRGPQKALTYGSSTPKRSEAPTRVYIPEGVGTRIRTTKSGAIIRGCEIMGPMMRTAGSVTLQLIPCNPIFWAATRAKRMAHLYSYYRVKHMAIKYKPAVGTDVDGTIICASIALTDKIGVGEHAQIMLSKHGSMMTAAWQDCVGVSREPMPYKMYMMGDWGAPTEGSFYMACLDNFTTATSSAALGQLMMEYEIELISESMSSDAHLKYDAPQVSSYSLTDGTSTATGAQQGSFLVQTAIADGGDVGTLPGDVWRVAKEAGTTLVWQLVRNGVTFAIDEFTGTIKGLFYGKQGDY